MRPKSFTPLVTIYVAAFYTGVIGSAISEQLHKVFFFIFLAHVFLIMVGYYL